MVESDEGFDPGLEQRIGEADVVVESSLVEGIIPPAEGDDARPREGEAVGGYAEGLEKGNVLGSAVVAVTGDGAAGPVGDFTGDGAKGVPDGGAAAVFGGGAFDLVAVLLLLSV